MVIMEKMCFEIVRDKYQNNTYTCKTLCPYVPEKYIGSIGCGWCEFHINELDDASDINRNFIFCKYKKLKGISKISNIIEFIIYLLVSLTFSYLGYINFVKHKFVISFVCFLISFVIYCIGDKIGALGKINKQNEPTKNTLFRQ
jgi:hypothetical protein